MNEEQQQELNRLAGDNSPLLDDYSKEACAAAVDELAQLRAYAKYASGCAEIEGFCTLDEWLVLHWKQEAQ